jgi:hypothetical protein
MLIQRNLRSRQLVKLAHSEGKPAKLAISKSEREKMVRYKDVY